MGEDSWEEQRAQGRTMASRAFQTWVTSRAAALDDIASAHRALRGSGAGVRAATQQVNQAFAMMLSAQFQAFCRELHTECVDHLLAGVPGPRLRALARVSLLLGRKLDRGNPNPGNIGSDYERFGIAFWTSVTSHRPQNAGRRTTLAVVNEWRNAIAHQDFTAGMLQGGRVRLSLAQVRGWRRACEGLAGSFDEVMRLHLLGLTGTSLW
jgi:hypothetical protein